MVKKDICDVVVVGVGPLGSSAAKICAEYRLKTLLLEKFKIPRPKVCAGALMCSMAQ
jgi:flavin-dependent dehydrogenase